MYDIGDLNPEKVSQAERWKLKELIENERYERFGYENDPDEVR